MGGRAGDFECGSDLPGAWTIQWHITERCNLRCTHCYQHSYDGPMMSREQMRDCLSQIRQLVGLSKVHFNITGGEPMAHPDFLWLIQELRRGQKNWSIGILSNGTLLTSDLADKLRQLRIGFVQVSIDGPREMHDSIRGQGNFEQAVEGLRLCHKAGIKTLIAFTAHSQNFRQFAEVAKIGVDLGVSRVWLDRLIPEGVGQNDSIRSLNSEESIELFDAMRSLHEKYKHTKTEIAMHRALQFLSGLGQVYKCTAGRSLLTIMHDGTIYPCRRLPVGVGNLFTTPLKEIYQSNPFLQELRNESPAKGCEKCFYTDVCGGGLKCLSYATHQDINRADPACWLAEPVESNAPRRIRLPIHSGEGVLTR